MDFLPWDANMGSHLLYLFIEENSGALYLGKGIFDDNNDDFFP